MSPLSEPAECALGGLGGGGGVGKRDIFIVETKKPP
jgi:hypothetical protein